MKAFHFATVVQSTLALDPLLPAYATITFALVEKTQGLLCAYGNSSGQLVVPVGLVGTNGAQVSLPSGVLSSSATLGVGYGAGAGGTVTQITNSSTGVTLNTTTGQITTVALTTAAGAEEVFTVTDSSVAATDIPVVTTTYAGAGTILVGVKKVVAGAFDIVITNLHASAAFNAAAVINFAVIKGSAS